MKRYAKLAVIVAVVALAGCGQSDGGQRGAVSGTASEAAGRDAIFKNLNRSMIKPDTASQGGGADAVFRNLNRSMLKGDSGQASKKE